MRQAEAHDDRASPETVRPIELSLESFQEGEFYTLSQARMKLEHADRRSLRKWIRVYRVPTYVCKAVNGSAVFVSQDGLRLLAEKTSRQLVDAACPVPPRSARRPGSLAALRIQYEDTIAAYEQLLQEMVASQAREKTLLSRQIDSLQKRVQELEGGQEEVADATDEGRALVSHRSRGTLQRLPRGYEMLDVFARKHGVNSHDLERAIAAGEIPIVEGNWRYGQTRVSRALDMGGQAAFHRRFLGTPVCNRCLLDTYGYIPSP